MLVPLAIASKHLRSTFPGIIRELTLIDRTVLTEVEYEPRVTSCDYIRSIPTDVSDLSSLL